MPLDKIAIKQSLGENYMQHGKNQSAVGARSYLQVAVSRAGCGSASRVDDDHFPSRSHRAADHAAAYAVGCTESRGILPNL
jgi:hypothetical protein